MGHTMTDIGWAGLLLLGSCRRIHQPPHWQGAGRPHRGEAGKVRPRALDGGTQGGAAAHARSVLVCAACCLLSP